MSKYVDENYDQPSNQPVTTYKQGNSKNNQVNASGKLSNVKYGPVTDPSSELEKCVGVLIKQIPEFFEAATGCETPNIYHVFGSSTSGFNFLFKCKEKSGWCMRHCCTSTRRGFDMDMSYIASGNPMDPIATDYATAYKSCNLACCCLCRPVMFGTYGAKQKKEKTDNNIVENEPMGEIIENCACGSNISVKGEDGTIKYKVIGDYSQWGYFCRFLSIGKCYEVDFWIYENDADPNKDKPVGNIHKVFKGLSELITDSDAFILTFPKNATAIERVLLIAAVIMIDYRYYETVALFDCGNLI